MSEMTQNAPPPPALPGAIRRFLTSSRSTPVGMALIVIALIIIFGFLSPNGASSASAISPPSFSTPR